MLIKVLDIGLANMIAAGEVVERPASVVKELVENAIDAGATSITVEIKAGGVSFIKVMDNGSGIHPDDAPTAFLRHATSKISDPSDLDHIMTLGFRGEALASIAAVSKVELLTKMPGMQVGYKVALEAGNVVWSGEWGCPEGTAIFVRDLFYNTPARMKFLKKDYTEAGYIEEMLRRLSFAHAEVSFRLISDQKEKLFTAGDFELKNTAYSIYGREVASALLGIDYKEGNISVSGLVGIPSLARKNRSMQTCFVNGRYVVNRTMTAAIEEAYKGEMTTGHYPVAIIKLSVDPTTVDVNVHPAKLEVKFAFEQEVYKAVYWACKNAIKAASIPTLRSDTAERIYTPPVILSQAPPQRQGIYENKNLLKEETQLPPLTSHPISGEEVQKPMESRPLPMQPVQKPLRNTLEDQQVIRTTLPVEEIGDFVVSGQVFGTYIIVEQDNHMILIDQHAAHERILFEQLMQMHENKEIYPQPLLVPSVIALSPVEFAFARENKEFFDQLGFEIDAFGNNDIAVRSVPIAIEPQRIKDIIQEIINNVMKNTQKNWSVKVEAALHTVACRGAVKGNKPLGPVQMQNLAKKILSGEWKMVCPHGRPVSVALEKSFIEKLFKRT